ncbi:MAG: phosphoglucosamine mutase [Candidatus Cloacimonadota bacterium]|nr:MAG: phosphoglucosamine mutase [Candidatus Cloacimonadota bacterium]PIE78151.1 MAG: phosphoglucosamine mutase [Candidatus Delongbacteria bacterium]
MSKLMVSVSGIRGIVGDSLTPNVIMDYVSAFAKYCGGGPIVVGRDTRPTGEAIMNLVCSTLNMCGVDVICVGIATTPTIEMGVKLYEAAGGIAITASHNPIEWNALKFFDKDTLFLDEVEGEKLQSILKSRDFNFVDYKEMGSTKYEYDEVKNYHIRSVLDLPYLNKGAIRKKGFKVVVDCVNGAGYEIIPEILEDLGCTVHRMFCEPTGEFPHGAEPLPENLTDICEVIKNGNYDLGMVVDPDSDRLALISDGGEPLGEEYTLAMVTDLILSKVETDVCVNISTSRAVDDICKKYNRKLYKAKVGEVNVSKKMLKNGCIIGGEGNGGVILPEIHPGRDAVVGVALILQYLLEKESFITDVFNELPQYSISKNKLQLENLDYDKIIGSLVEGVEPDKISRLDGVRIDKEDHWIQIRKSNTEPIARIFVEAETKEKAEKIYEEYISKINTSI